MRLEKLQKNMKKRLDKLHFIAIIRVDKLIEGTDNSYD